MIWKKISRNSRIANKINIVNKIINKEIMKNNNIKKINISKFNKNSKIKCKYRIMKKIILKKINLGKNNFKIIKKNKIILIMEKIVVIIKML